ncbi:MAG TPA: dihydroneopterin aldolase [Candidatus Dormibacteraeota bacterium]|jgi:dihydroneopterin aldolase
MDRILMEGMTFRGHHGVHPAERELGAPFTVDVQLELDLAEAGHSDRLEDTVDYARAHHLVGEVVEGESCHLIETLAERIAARMLALERVRRTTVTVRKQPPLRGQFRSFGVEVSRSR